MPDQMLLYLKSSKMLVVQEKYGNNMFVDQAQQFMWGCRQLPQHLTDG